MVQNKESKLPSTLNVFFPRGLAAIGVVLMLVLAGQGTSQATHQDETNHLLQKQVEAALTRLDMTVPTDLQILLDPVVLDSLAAYYVRALSAQQSPQDALSVVVLIQQGLQENPFLRDHPHYPELMEEVNEEIEELLDALATPQPMGQCVHDDFDILPEGGILAGPGCLILKLAGPAITIALLVLILAMDALDSLSPEEDPLPCEGCIPYEFRPAPPTPKAHPLTGRLVESISPTTGSMDKAHDWDQDSTPDILDTVNLPSESSLATTGVDSILIPEGLAEGGFVLLVEPGHRQAHLVLTAQLLPSSTTPLSATEALDRVESSLGTRTRNTLAMAITDGMTLHTTEVLPSTSTTLSLAWNDAPLAADGTWLLVHSDPTRRLQLTLAGLEADVATPAASQFSSNATELRWQFLNPHEDQGFCYDSTTPTQATECGGNQWPGWLRAYSGNAASTLQAIHDGLQQGHLPTSITTDDGTLPLNLTLIPTQSSQSDTLNIFTPDSPWHLLGNQSHPFSAGVGIDYRLGAPAHGHQGLVRQVANPTLEPLESRNLRQFLFQGAYVHMPAEPRDMAHIQLGIRPVGDDHGPASFVLDGAYLEEVLDIQFGEELKVDISASHQEGFTHERQDLNRDGIQDLIVHIPHFSEPWITIYNADTYVHFWDVVMTSPTTAWITGADGAVYRYASGSMTRYAIPGHGSQRTFGLHVVSDTEFWVAGEYNSQSDQRTAFIAHYRSTSLSTSDSAWVSVTDMPPGHSYLSLYDIWINTGGNRGYAGGGQGVWFEYDGSQWTSRPRPSIACGVMDIRFNNLGQGLIALNKGRGSAGSCLDETESSSIMYHNSGTFSKYGGDGGGIYAIDEYPGSWAAGFRPIGDDSKPGIYKKVSSNSWQNHAPPALSARDYFGVAKVPGVDEHWFAGQGDCNSCGSLAHRSGTAWSTFSTPYNTHLRQVDFYDSRTGLAVGLGSVLQYVGNSAPTAKETVTSTGDVTDLFSADGSASSDTDGDTLHHQWDWGDGQHSTGESVSHYYDQVGSFTVTHTVKDGFDQDTSTKTISVNPVLLSVGSSKSETLESGHAERRHVYRIDSTSSDRMLSIETTNADVELLAWLEDDAANTAQWPETGARAATLVGTVPSGDDLYVAVTRTSATSTTSESYVLSASLIPAPTVPTLTLPSPANGAGLTSVTYTQGTSTDSAAWIDWGDGVIERVPSSGHEPSSPSGEKTTGHDHDRGTYTVSVRIEDRYGQQSPWQSASVTVIDPAASTATGATNITTTGATLQGTLDDLGGDSSVSVWYRIAGVGTYGPFTRSSTGTLPSQSVSGLEPGTTYTYTVRVANGATTAESVGVSFSTVAQLGIDPIVSGPSSRSLGSSGTYSFVASAFHSQGVAYLVDWGDGTTVRVPSSGFVSWDQSVSTSHAWAFAGSQVVEVRMVDQSGIRSDRVLETVSVTGGSPTTGLDLETRPDDAVIGTTLNDLGASVRVRFCYREVGTSSWTCGAWSGLLGEGASPSSSTGSLDRAKLYMARLELETSDGRDYVLPASQHREFQTNRAPVLSLATAPAAVDHHEQVRFSVTYRDLDGDAPRNDFGAVSAPVLVVQGQEYVMHGPQNPDYAGGVEYHYNLRLNPGRSHVASFGAQDSHQDAARVTASTFVHASSVGAWSFTGDALGETPTGFTRSSGNLNYWHITDTEEADMPERVALGRNGKALWFGQETRGSYQDSGGKTPSGSIQTGTLDLGLVDAPVLSFSSFYETEDLGTTRDKKLVELRYVTSSGFWSSWGLVHQVSGYEGGYGQWRTQHVDLAAYDGKQVQLRFRFDAVDAWHNAHLGWFIDDVVVGQDSDGDSLPDDLEDMRRELRVAQQWGAKPIEPGEFTRSHVRRLVRPHADSVALHSIITHNRPNDLVVTIGIEQDLENQNERSFVVWDQGTPFNTCTWNSGTKSYPAQSRPVVVVEPNEGLDIQIDMIACPAAWNGFTDPMLLGAHDWFVEVLDKGSRGGWIDVLSVTTSGMTASWRADTDRDGYNDGRELADLLDPLGVDADGDSIHERLDSNDNVPDWIPAFVMYTRTQFSDTTWFDFKDNMGTITFFDVVAEYDSGTQSKPLPISGRHGTAWYVDLSDEVVLPDRLVATWRDAHGLTGVIVAGMTIHANGQWGPNEVEFRHSFGAGAEQVHQLSWSAFATGLGWGGFGTGLTAAETAGAMQALRAVGVAAARLLGILAVVTLAPTAGGGQTIATQLISAEGGLVVTGSLTGSLLIPEVVLDDALTRYGFTASELQGIVDNVAEIVTDVEGLNRIIHHGQGGLVVITSLGNQVQNLRHWPMPTTLGWENPIGWNSVYQVANHVVEKLHAGDAERYEYGTCLRACPVRDKDDELEIATVQLEDHGTGRPETEPQVAMQVPAEWLEAPGALFEALELLKKFSPQSTTDAEVAVITMHSLQQMAHDNLMTNDVNWYWDNGATEVDCDTIPVPDVRRCIDFRLDEQVSLRDWIDPFRPDKLETISSEWVTTSNVVKFSDAWTTKGIVNPKQEAEWPLQAGADELQSIRDEIDAKLEGANWSGVDADVRLSYVWKDQEEAKARAHYGDMS